MSHIWKGLLVTALLPFAATTAEAQHRGGGGHPGGGRPGGGYPGGGAYGGAYRGYGYPGGYYGPRNTYGLNVSPYGVNFGYRYSSPNVGVGVTLGTGGLGYGYGGYGGYYGGYRPSYYGGYPYGLSSWSFASPYSYPLAYSAPATSALVGAAIPVVPSTSPPPADPIPGNVAFVEVRVPDGAQVWLGPTPSDQTGPVRTFVSPPLDTGYDYSYVIRVRWSENGTPMTRERKVPVRVGDRLSIDMTRP